MRNVLHVVRLLSSCFKKVFDSFPRRVRNGGTSYPLGIERKVPEWSTTAMHSHTPATVPCTVSEWLYGEELYSFHRLRSGGLAVRSELE